MADISKWNSAVSTDWKTQAIAALNAVVTPPKKASATTAVSAPAKFKKPTTFAQVIEYTGLCGHEVDLTKLDVYQDFMTSLMKRANMAKAAREQRIVDAENCSKQKLAKEAECKTLEDKTHKTCKENDRITCLNIEIGEAGANVGKLRLDAENKLTFAHNAKIYAEYVLVIYNAEKHVANSYIAMEKLLHETGKEPSNIAIALYMEKLEKLRVIQSTTVQPDYPSDE
jgi:hypothetical protein